jgi:FkbM family methyltransferase
MLQTIRLKVIKALIDLNERMFFERRLASTYKSLNGQNFRNILDVGANKGQTISFFLRMNRDCKISSFEPNKSLFKKLNGKYGPLPNVKIYNLGISDGKGEKLFRGNVLAYTSTFEELNPDSKYLKNKSSILGVKPDAIVKDKYIVNTTTLAAFINEHINETIDVLKIDIEGHEFAALNGLFAEPIKNSIRYIQIEDHTDDMYLNKTPFESIKALLADNGFAIKCIIKHGFGNINEVIFYNTTINN